MAIKTVHDGDILERNGRQFRVNILDDDDREPPWDRSDGHGPVRKVNRSHCSQDAGKHPGERPMNSPDRNEYQFFYDWQAACKQARAEGWNTEPYDAPNRIARAVQADFEFLSGWVNDQWRYVGVVCTDVTDDEEAPNEYASALWGVESCAGAYLLEVAEELIAEQLAGYACDEQQARIASRFNDAMDCGV